MVNSMVNEVVDQECQKPKLQIFFKSFNYLFLLNNILLIESLNHITYTTYGNEEGGDGLVLACRRHAEVLM